MPLQIIREDITELAVDAIVNPTNPRMYGYSGIDALVHQKAGPEMDALCEAQEPLELGFARMTPGFRLKAKYVIHTCGPVWQNGQCGEKALLRSCYLESLKLAGKAGCRTVAFPLISSGAYGYPKDQVLKHAVEVISEFLMDNEMQVLLCVHDPSAYEFSRTLYADISRYIDSFRELPMLSACEAEESMQAPRLGKAAPKARCEEPAWEETEFACAAPMPGDLREYLAQMDAGFAETLFAFIDQRGITDVECYKKANVDKKLFSKIKSKPHYKPSKQTALAFAIALELSLPETQQLLRTLGMTLSHSSPFDLIVEYFIVNGRYNVFDVNEALFEFDQPLLGSVEK